MPKAAPVPKKAQHTPTFDSYQETYEKAGKVGYISIKIPPSLQ